MKNYGFIILFAFLANSAIGAETYYIQSAKAKLHIKPSYNSKVIDIIKKGSTVIVVKVQGRWVKVNTQGKADQKKTGWLSKLLVSNKPPLERVSALKGKEISDHARRRASNVATSAAARGLSAENRARLSAENRFDYETLSRIESTSIKDSDVWQFLDKGMTQK